MPLGADPSKSLKIFGLVCASYDGVKKGLNCLSFDSLFTL